MFFEFFFFWSLFVAFFEILTKSAFGMEEGKEKKRLRGCKNIWENISFDEKKAERNPRIILSLSRPSKRKG